MLGVGGPPRSTAKKKRKKNLPGWGKKVLNARKRKLRVTQTKGKTKARHLGTRKKKCAPQRVERTPSTVSR